MLPLRVPVQPGPGPGCVGNGMTFIVAVRGEDYVALLLDKTVISAVRGRPPETRPGCRYWRYDCGERPVIFLKTRLK